MSKRVAHRKEEPKAPEGLHPAAKTWNAFMETMEKARLQWEEHQIAYMANRASIPMYSRATQLQLSGILHTQHFSHVLDFLVRNSKIGYEPLIIKE